ncbi:MULTISPECIES: GtrA family protein [unclassified Streptomyces]|uniref:GtrA family protein n=1 Tax=unclassified Streptomyces TaxID=2593676 RepID=UPI00380A64E0
MKSASSSQLSTAPGPFGAFVRFVACGGGTGVASTVSLALLALVMPWALANALTTVASTVVATELHSRFTFGGGRAGWRRHLQSFGSAAGAYVVTCAAMFVLHLLVASPGVLWEQVVYLSAAGLAGIGRFVVLRLFVFGGGRGQDLPENRPEERTGAPVTAVVSRRAGRWDDLGLVGAGGGRRVGSAHWGPSPGRAQRGRRRPPGGTAGQRPGQGRQFSTARVRA